MAKTRKPAVKTFHPLDVAKSLEAQNEKVGLLIQAVESFLSVHSELTGADLLRRAVDDAYAAMWPEEDGDDE